MVDVGVGGRASWKVFTTRLKKPVRGCREVPGRPWKWAFDDKNATLFLATLML